ncbi:hypothetical protein HDV02_000784 [Globomyces sp. JEL0801]|nr:hypothetical protein HDV02_000784 [Globomyces sp. JEL0801]
MIFNLFSVPSPLLAEILKYLNPKDQSSFVSTCRYFDQYRSNLFQTSKYLTIQNHFDESKLSEFILNNIQSLEVSSHFLFTKQGIIVYYSPIKVATNDINWDKLGRFKKILRLDLVSHDSINRMDISPLTHFTNLKSLNIRHTCVDNLDPISGLINLQSLQLNYMHISDLRFLSDLMQLNTLALNFNKAETLDISPVSNLKRLKKLELEQSGINDLEPLCHIEDLQYLDVSRLIGRDLSPIVKIKSLETLRITHNQIPDLTIYSSLPNLHTLDLAGSSFDVSGLSAFTSIQNLTVNRTSNPALLVSISTLTTMTSLHLWRNSISDVSHLSNLLNLVSLNLAENKIVDVSPLSRLTKLQKLNLFLNQVKDVSALSTLYNLKMIDLMANPVTEFSSLSKIKGLIIKRNYKQNSLWTPTC